MLAIFVIGDVLNLKDGELIDWMAINFSQPTLSKSARHDAIMPMDLLSSSSVITNGGANLILDQEISFKEF
jgi:hypothetical protein